MNYIREEEGSPMKITEKLHAIMYSLCKAFYGTAIMSHIANYFWQYRQLLRFQNVAFVFFCISFCAVQVDGSSQNHRKEIVLYFAFTRR